MWKFKTANSWDRTFEFGVEEKKYYTLVHDCMYCITRRKRTVPVCTDTANMSWSGANWSAWCLWDGWGLRHVNYQTVHCIDNYYTSGSFSSLTRCGQQHKYIPYCRKYSAHTACFYLQAHYITTSQLKRFLRRNKNVSRGKGKNIIFGGEREGI